MSGLAQQLEHLNRTREKIRTDLLGPAAQPHLELYDTAIAALAQLLLQGSEDRDEIGRHLTALETAVIEMSTRSDLATGEVLKEIEEAGDPSGAWLLKSCFEDLQLLIHSERGIATVRWLQNQTLARLFIPSILRWLQERGKEADERKDK